MDRRFIQARAKIIWGEPPESVLSYLASEGLSEAQAQAAIKSIIAERHDHIRRVGLRRVIINGLAIAPFLYVGLLLFTDNIQLGHHYRYQSSTLVMIGIAYFFWKFTDGLYWLLAPQMIRGAIGMEDE